MLNKSYDFIKLQKIIEIKFQRAGRSQSWKSNILLIFLFSECKLFNKNFLGEIVNFFLPKLEQNKNI